MNKKYTPGQWHLIRSGMRDNSAVATLEPSPPTMDEPNYWTVAHVNTLRLEWEANARLIASAPLLLEALQEAVALADKNCHAWDGKPDRTPECQASYDKCVAAILAATGGWE
jgi:hypothetical protein